MKPMCIVILGLFLMLPCAALSDEERQVFALRSSHFIRRSMMVSWTGPTTRLRTGTTSIPTEVVTGAAKQHSKRCVQCIKHS